MFKREIKPLSESMVDSIAKSINKLEYVEEKASRPADSAEGDVKAKDISGEEEVTKDGSAAKAPARKGDQAQADSMEKIKEDASNDESDDGEGLDKVDPKAVKKKFADRKDKDIDNDGDTDSSDEYLHKRRKAISKALESKKPEASVDESAELEGLDEANMSRVAKELEAYARKNGGIDKMDFMKAAMMMKRGQTAQLKKFVDDLDTEPREKILSLMNEEVELDEKVNTKAIQKAVDDGKSMDAIMTMFANKRTTNTDEIRKVVKDYMWKKRMKKEEVELDEAKNYEIKDGKVHISKANFRKVHKDYKNATKGKERMMALDPKTGGTTSFPVVFTEEVELDEAKELTPKAVIDYLVKKGVNPKDAKDAVNKGFGYANKKYGGATYSAALKKVADVIWTLHEAKETLDELDEAKSDYTIYHKTFSSAVQHAVEVAKKRGYEVDDEEYDRKVAMGPRKPSKGKTNSYSIALTKNGKPTKQKLQMQVYYDEGRYELNMYIS